MDNEESQPNKPKPKSNGKLVKVKFQKSWSIYNKGEDAGFPQQKADWLVSKKLAVKA